MPSDTTTITVPTALVEAVRALRSRCADNAAVRDLFDAEADLADAVLSASPAPAQPDLDAIEAAMRGATPGPWVALRDAAGEAYVDARRSDGGSDDVVHVDSDRPHADARAIVAAVNAVPALVAEVRWLRAAIAVFRAWGEARRVEREAGAAHDLVRYAVGPESMATRAARDAAQHACRRAFEVACAEADALVAHGVSRG